jgi:hypothetical protein
MNIHRRLYPQDRLDYALIGWIAACLVIWLIESRSDTPTADDDRPDYAILTECDLLALADGDAQTVQTGHGELVRLAAVEEGNDSDG